MQFTDYLKEIDFAAREVSSTIWAERDQLDELKAEISRLGITINYEYQRALALQEGEDADDVMMGVGLYWENYFGADKEMFHRNEETQVLSNRIAIHEFSIACLSGNLLQYAKQGISIVHRGVANCADGKFIGTQPLKSIIWQARNQALHWEEGIFHPPVQLCFQQLAAEIDPKFANYVGQSMAFNVVELLGWRDYKVFEADLLSLQ